MSTHIQVLFFATITTLCPYTYAAVSTLESGHRIEQSALVAPEQNAYNAALPLECTPLDIPIVTFDQNVKSKVTVAGNEIKFTPTLNEGVVITAAYTCP